VVIPWSSYEQKSSVFGPFTNFVITCSICTNAESLRENKNIIKISQTNKKHLGEMPNKILAGYIN